MFPLIFFIHRQSYIYLCVYADTNVIDVAVRAPSIVKSRGEEEKDVQRPYVDSGTAIAAGTWTGAVGCSCCCCCCWDSG